MRWILFFVSHNLERLTFPARLGSIQQLLADQMDTNPSEGMHRVVKCFHGSNRLGEDTIVAMLPEEVLKHTEGWLRSLSILRGILKIMIGNKNEVHTFKILAPF